MAFRDDKDALDQRLADLERDLKGAREDLDRKGDELQRLRERMGGLEKPAARKLSPMVAVGVGVACLGGAGAMWLATAHPPPPVAQSFPPPEEVAANEPPPLPTLPPKPPVRERVPPTPEPSRATTDLVWKATVSSTSGVFTSPSVGTACTIEATVTGGDRIRIDGDHLVVRCGGAKLYDRATPGGGSLSDDIREIRTAGAFVYQLGYFDRGARSPDERPELEIVSEHRVARVFRDGVRAGAVDLAVDPNSQPRKGDALVTPSPK